MILKAENLFKNFGEKEVLKGISLTVKSGEALGLLGRNGAGKTTTIRIIMDVFHADKGTVTLDGKPIKHSELNIGYMPEERGLYPKKLIIDQLVYLAELHGVKKKKAIENADYWLDRLEMSDQRNKKLNTLSKGNQQKIQLAATLISDPDLIILDEPFSGLDPVNANVLKDIVRELIDSGKIVLFSSHQMNYIEEFCSEIAIINNGIITIAGNIKKIKRSYDRKKIVVSGKDIENVKQYAQAELTDIVEKTEYFEESVMLHIKEAEQKNKLINELTSRNFDIDEFRVYEPSLSDIFVEYTAE